MRFALKTLILAMMVMMIASVAIAQQDFKPTLRLFGMTRVEVMHETVDDATAAAANHLDSTTFRIGRLQLGFEVKPHADVTLRGEFRLKGESNKSIAADFGDSWGQWFIAGGPVYIKAGLWWNNVAGGWSEGNLDPWYSCMIDSARETSFELGLKMSFLHVGLAAYKSYSPNSSASHENDINDMYAFARATPKLGPAELRINIGFETHAGNAYLDGTAYATPTVSDKLMGMVAEVGVEVMNIHFLAGGWFRLNDDNVATNLVKMAIGIELGYRVPSISGYFGFKYNMAVLEADETDGAWTASKNQIGITLGVSPVKSMSIALESVYNIDGRKSLFTYFKLQWAFSKIIGL